MRTYTQVLTPSEKITAFLLRHANRLLDPERINDVPRGLWVCEEDEEPILALLAYTDPYLRVSLIIDKPETRPFASLLKLVQMFESWGKAVGGTGYGVVVETADEHYRYLIESYGGTPTTYSMTWTEFFVPFERRPNTEDGIRQWEQLDWRNLKPLVRSYLFDTFAAGSSILPTQMNVSRFIASGMHAARKGEPVLVGIEDHRLIAFAGIISPQSPYDISEGYGVGMGTYVHPKYRRKKWATRIREEVLRRGKEFGFTRFTGPVFNKAGFTSAKLIGMKEQAVLMTKVL